jgi:flagellin FlaB
MIRKLRNRRGVTGLETAIILVAFVITAAAFAFVILNMGFITSEKAQSVIASGMSEATSALMVDNGVVANFANVSLGEQSDICLTKLTFYIKLSQGHTPIDIDDSRLVATFTNERHHGELYDVNGTIMTMTCVNGDGDTLLEVGEKYRVDINFTEIANDGVDPAVVTRPDLYCHSYETFRIELRPAEGAVLSINREIPAVYVAVMTLD